MDDPQIAPWSRRFAGAGGLTQSSSRTVAAVAVALFAGITVVRLLTTSPGFGITLLYDVPVALVAVAFGFVPGLFAATTGLALFALVDVTRPISVNGAAVHNNAAGYVSRALVFYLLAGLLGLYADRLRSTEKLLGGVLDSATDAIVTADEAGVIVGFNRAAEAMFGRQAASALGDPLTALMPEPFRAQHTAGLNRYLQSGETRVIGTTVELEAIRTNGEIFPIELSLATFRVRGATFFTAVIADITERNRLARERTRHLADLERSNAELERFAYVASHDLQAPLRSVGGFVEILQRRYRGQLDDDADRYIGLVVSGVERMQALIRDLLEYSQAGRSELNVQTTDVGRVFDGVLAALEGPIADAGASIHRADMPTIPADPTALGQVFQNLLTNAMKFARDEAPRIDVSAEQLGTDWCFSVADNGIGIDAEFAERIFGMFQRLHTRSEFDGTGIGLAICKTLVERHSGRIWCEPRDGGGTVFRFTIPGTPVT